MIGWPNTVGKSPSGPFSVNSTVSGFTARIPTIRSANACAGEETLSMCRWVLRMTAFASSGVPSEKLTFGRSVSTQVVPPSGVVIDSAR
ncbi:hypothetical protein BJF78_33780 [Pseudonocardia sp. CNS-139]|nr:hypothetical protein BJF78_33780 [Pseudonocardia sp. CNS-139]